MKTQSSQVAWFGRFAGSCLAMAALALALGGQANAQAAGGKTESKVKLSAKADKIGSDGKQVVTIKMEIEKGWHAYANPVKNETLESAQTEVKISGARKPESVAVSYPPGHLQKVGDESYHVYEGNVEFKATVTRAAGDTGPLEVQVNFSVCNDKLCLPPETVKLEVK